MELNILLSPLIDSSTRECVDILSGMHINWEYLMDLSKDGLHTVLFSDERDSVSLGILLHQTVLRGNTT